MPFTAPHASHPITTERMNDHCCVLSFPEYVDAAQRLAAALRLPCRAIDLHRFPDGESCVRVPSTPVEHAILCRSLFSPNDKLIELMLTSATLRDRGTVRITLVAPYLCYMRQDAEFYPGDAISQKIIGAFLAQQVDTLITVDPHLHRVHALEHAIPALRTVTLSATTLFGPCLREHAEPPLLLGPDRESEQWVRTIAQAHDLDFAIAQKDRSGDTSVRVELPSRSFKNRDVVLIDDVISTGRTLAAAAQQAMRAGARSVRALATHGVFVEDAEAFMRNAGIQDVWTSDSIPHHSNRFALAELIAAAID